MNILETTENQVEKNIHGYVTNNQEYFDQTNEPDTYKTPDGCVVKINTDGSINVKSEDILTLNQAWLDTNEGLVDEQGVIL